MSKKNQTSALSGQLAPVFMFANIAALLLVAVILFTALFSYHPADPAWSHNDGGEIQNSLGVMGAWYSDLSFSILGKLSYLLPLALVAFAVQIGLGKGIDKEVLSWRLFMLLTAIISGCVLWTKHDPAAINEVAITGGGALGAWLTIGLEKSVKSISVIMAFSTIIFLISLTLLFNIPWLKIAEWIGKGLSLLLGGVFSGLAAGRKRSQVNKAARASKSRDDELQENIQRLNSLVDRKKADEKPKFSIDRYTPEEEYADEYKAPQVTAFAATDTFSNNEKKQTAAAQQPATAAYPLHQEATLKSRQEAPLTTGSEQEIPVDFSSTTSEQKSEPNFFDFGEIRPKRERVGQPFSEQSSHSEPSNLESPIFTEETPKQPIATLSNVQSLNSSRTEESSTAFNVDETPSTTLFDTPKRTSQFEPPSEQQVEPFSAVASDNTIEDSTIEPSEALIKAIHDSSANTTSPETTAALKQPQANTEPESVAAEPTTHIVSQATTEPVVPQSDSQASTATAATAASVVAANAETPSAVGTKINKVSIGRVYDSRAEEAATPPPPKRHTLPSIDLLDTPPPQENAYTEDVLAEMAGVLERTLKQFNVDATVMHVSPGPVITRFEIDLAPGIQAKKITSLSVDLARALAVSGVRVEEVIPGSSYVGLEVPNKQRQIVYFKDVVRSKAFQSSQSPLTVSLGADTSGKPVTADLMKMPHALVAGTTGSGKSVCINVMLLSMLYKASPKDLRLILVDPKMLEMSMYEDIPHLLTPVITDMNEAENALTWAVGEMERRYQLMAALKVRKIDAFNQAVDTANARGEPIKDPLWNPDESVGYTHHPNLERLPFIVIVIDELADMMMVVGKQVEQLIARLTQKARAAGLHVVLATQRPSTDVLTGLIKANVPTRIAFQVSSGTDSRVIIDSVGAEKLLGHGDMLYVPPGAGHPQRLHGAFVDDAETDRITTYLRSMGEPDYIDGITGKQDPETLGAFGAAEAAEAKEDADPLYEEAVQIVLQTGKASISSVQRQLRIGYNRAARMIEDMQDQGIVSEPVNGIRKVLASPPAE